MDASSINPGTWSRREFIHRSAAALAGVAGAGRVGGGLPVGLEKRLIVLTLSGGMSHLDTFDPKPDCPEVMGSTRAIATSAHGVLVGHHLPRTARIMDRVCVIRSMRTSSPDHREAIAAMRVSDGLDRIVCSSGSSDPRMMLVDRSNRQFHSHELSPLPRDPRSVPSEALNFNSESPATLRLYGEGGFARNCLLARRKIESGAKAVGVELPGWDTHIDHFTGVAGRCLEFDRAFAALIMDLEDRGMLDDTLVVVATEFGRSPEIQRQHRNGRDHHPAAFSCVLAGAGIAGGTTIGKTDGSGSAVVEHPVTVEDFHAMIARVVQPSLHFRNQQPHRP